MKPPFSAVKRAPALLPCTVALSMPLIASAQPTPPNDVRPAGTSTEALEALGLPSPPLDTGAPSLETLTILGRREEARRISGSAHRIDSEVLTDFEYDDIQRVLTKVPGVYVRDEDGFGLRPNIGLRGANSDRSSRVVLMEDTVLLSPAPYSAPAAYYTPLLTRMVGIEVFKGPASIRHGPYTVGGAINFQTAEVPAGHKGAADVAVGQFNYLKLHGRYGWGGTHYGFLVEGVRLDSGGFKELDGDPSANTGFTKNEVMVKARLNSSPGADMYHRLDIKLGYSDELSNETYLGLTDDDFRASPFRRYRGSQLDRMEWTRTQAQARYGLFWGDEQKVFLTAYRHDFTRAWLKVNNFRTLAGGRITRVDSVLRDQTAPNATELLRMVRGEVSSESIFSAANVPSFIGIGTNDRTFVSQGLQLDGELHLDFIDFEQEIRFGARLHYDEIKRRHDEAPYEMVVLNNQPATVVQAGPIEPTTVNDESALAISLYAQDEVTLFDDFVITPGIRTEIISTRSESPGRDAITDDQLVVIPGIGAYVQVLDWLGVLAGVHRGFSPVAPGQLDEIEPESSLNYEFGVRANDGAKRRIELIGFYNDYANLLLNCSVSSGCIDNDQQFNAGDIELYGAELSAHLDQQIGDDIALTFDAAYTWTQSRINNDIQSESLQFEDAEEGDRLPYVPEHQASVSAGVTIPVFGAKTGLRLSYTFVDRMRNEASGDDAIDADFTDTQHLLDGTLLVDFTEQYRLYVRADNILDQRYITSRRPFGARPGKPFQVQVGFTFQFEED